jgi:cell wall-associated NlpC family hydrolase
MSAFAQAFANAAISLIGTRFRLYGRHQDTGVDCIGLVYLALAIAGKPLKPLHDYGLRNRDYERFLGAFDKAGFGSSSDDIAAGDIVLVRPGPAQVHLLIATGPSKFVHAHAGLGRVVMALQPHGWPELGRWRAIRNERE